MGNIVGTISLPQRKISDETDPSLNIERQKSRELFFKVKPGSWSRCKTQFL